MTPYHRRPGPGWTLVNIGLPIAGTLSEGAYRRGRINVISSLIWAELPDGKGAGLQWLVSVSSRGRRPKIGDLREALDAFGMRHAEEDNHESGIARKFFLVCDPARRVACQCKTTERTITERDGYRYSVPRK